MKTENNVTTNTRVHKMAGQYKDEEKTEI